MTKKTKKTRKTATNKVKPNQEVGAEKTLQPASVDNLATGTLNDDASRPGETEEEHYERVWGTAFLEEQVKKGLTQEHIERIADAPASEEVDMSNPHLPTKDEVAHKIVKQILDTNNTRITISTVEDLKDFAEKNKEVESTGDYTNDILRHFSTSKTNVQIEPKIFFDYVKDCLTKVEVEELTARLNRFVQIFEITSKSGQLALKENARDNIIRLVKEQEAASCGYSIYVLEKTIQTFSKNVKGKVCHFKPFREFPRLIPDEIISKLSVAQSKNIFDEYWILYLDYSKENIKSTTTKVIDKDPILFGKITKESDKLFYIADWIDEYCTLTLNEFVKAMEKIDPSYSLPEVKSPKINEIGELLEEKKRQEKVLANTNRNNYRSLAEQEEAPKKQGFLKRIFNFSF